MWYLGAVALRLPLRRSHTHIHHLPTSFGRPYIHASHVGISKRTNERTKRLLIQQCQLRSLPLTPGVVPDIRHRRSLPRVWRPLSLARLTRICTYVPCLLFAGLSIVHVFTELSALRVREVGTSLESNVAYHMRIRASIFIAT